MGRGIEKGERSSKINESNDSRYDEYKKSSSSSSRDENCSYEYRHREQSSDRKDRHSYPSSRSHHYNNVDSYDKHRNSKRSSPEETDEARQYEELRNRIQSKRSKRDKYAESDKEKYKFSKHKTIEERELMKRSKRDLHREKEYNKSPQSHRHRRCHKRNSNKIANESYEEQNYKRNRRSHSSATLSAHSKSSKSDRSSKNDDSDVPISPLSTSDLSKLNHRRQRSETKFSRDYSKSKSTTSRSGSKSSYTSHSEERSEITETVGMKLNVSIEPEPIETREPTTDVIEDSEDDEKELPAYYPGLQGCRSVEEFKCLNRIAEGTYGVVFRAQDKHTEEIVALKRFKMENETEGFPITSLREINTLLKGQHPNIVTVREIVVGSNIDKIFIVMDFVEHDFSSLMETMKKRNQYFLPAEVKCLTQQLLRAVAHLHDNWILHRDLKTSNLLLSHNGILKVGDFGLAREYGSPLKPYTPVVVTQWYRAPELLLCCKLYSTSIDIWSVGCIFAEFLRMCPLFPGKSEIDQLHVIFKLLGTPNEGIWPDLNEMPAVKSGIIDKFTKFPKSNVHGKFGRCTSELGRDLLQGMLAYDPKQRYTAEQALNSNYFRESPLPIDPAMLPTWPAKSEMGAQNGHAPQSNPTKPQSRDGQYEMQVAVDVNEDRGFILGANLNAEARQIAMGPGFTLKF